MLNENRYLIDPKGLGDYPEEMDMRKCQFCNNKVYYYNNTFDVCSDCIEEMKQESNCCTAKIYENTDICSKCKEHCDTNWNSFFQGEVELQRERGKKKAIDISWNTREQELRKQAKERKEFQQEIGLRKIQYSVENNLDTIIQSEIFNRRAKFLL